MLRLFTLDTRIFLYLSLSCFFPHFCLVFIYLSGYQVSTIFMGNRCFVIWRNETRSQSHLENWWIDVCMVYVYNIGQKFFRIINLWTCRYISSYMSNNFVVHWFQFIRDNRIFSSDIVGIRWFTKFIYSSEEWDFIESWLKSKITYWLLFQYLYSLKWKL